MRPEIFLFLYVVCLLWDVSKCQNVCFNLSIETSVLDVMPISHRIKTTEFADRSQCVRECLFNVRCLSLFYSEQSRSCFLNEREVSGLVLYPNLGWVGFDFPDTARIQWTVANPAPMELWVAEVLGFSSQFDSQSAPNSIVNLATSVIGPNDVYPQHGDSSNAWAPEDEFGTEWIEVKIIQALYIVRIDVYETYQPGRTSEIRAKTPTGDWDTIWTNPQLTVVTSSKINSIPLQVPYAADTLLIFVELGGYHIELDAVKFVGWPA